MDEQEELERLTSEIQDAMAATLQARAEPTTRDTAKESFLRQVGWLMQNPRVQKIEIDPSDLRNVKVTIAEPAPRITIKVGH